ncbi:MAG: hypothetical protein JNL38_27920 [Myxococcales bacterium]|nr:hypothetical protein [Myxococcales bacterium]
MPGVDVGAVLEARLAEGQGLCVVKASWLAAARLSGDARERCLAVADPLAAMRVVAARFRRAAAGPVIAVGGANGKTTTKEMIAACLSGPGRVVARTPGNNNGWVGVAYTLLLREHAAARPPDAVVVEIGVDEPGAMAPHAALVAPDLAVLSSLGAEHLAGFGTVERAAEEEMILFAHARRRVWNLADADVASRAAVRPGDVVVAPGLSRHEPSPGASLLSYDVVAAAGAPLAFTIRWRFVEDGRALEGEAPVPVVGRHNAGNAALALATALACGRSAEDAARGLASLPSPGAGTGGRSRLVVAPSGALVLDDAYNASPASTRAALAMITDPSLGERPRLAVLGDMLDLGDASAAEHLALASELAAARGLHLRLYGDAMRGLFDRLVDDDLGELASLAHAPSTADPRVLLEGIAPGPPLGAAAILVKGSRGNGLERVVEALAAAPDAGR